LLRLSEPMNLDLSKLKKIKKKQNKEKEQLKNCS